MRKLTNGVNDSDSTETVENDAESETEFAVSMHGGHYVNTYLAGDKIEASVRAYEEGGSLFIEDEVTVTDVSDGSFEHIFLEDVVDTSPDEPWESGAGGRFSNLQHTDPERVDGVLQGLRETSDRVDGIEKLVDVVEKEAENLTDDDFTCPVCGLSHGHSIEKHDVREIYGVTDLFADAVMEFNPLCHCGLHELGRLVESYDGDVPMFEDGKPSAEKVSDIQSAAENAPVPNSVIQSLDETYGL
jgi:hypothetical protein